MSRPQGHFTERICPFSCLQQATGLAADSDGAGSLTRFWLRLAVTGRRARQEYGEGERSAAPSLLDETKVPGTLGFSQRVGNTHSGPRLETKLRLAAWFLGYRIAVIYIRSKDLSILVRVVYRDDIIQLSCLLWPSGRGRPISCKCFEPYRYTAGMRHPTKKASDALLRKPLTRHNQLETTATSSEQQILSNVPTHDGFPPPKLL